MAAFTGTGRLSEAVGIGTRIGSITLTGAVEQTVARIAGGVYWKRRELFVF